MLRFNALNSVQNKKPLQVAENGKRSELFAINVFNEVAMRQLMTRDAFDAGGDERYSIRHQNRPPCG